MSDMGFTDGEETDDETMCPLPSNDSVSLGPFFDTDVELMSRRRYLGGFENARKPSPGNESVTT